MAILETEAFVLRAFKLAEHDKIVLVLSHDYGKIRLIAKGARGSKARFGSSLEPFSKILVSFYHKEGRELFNIQRTDLLRSSFALASEPDTFAELSYAAELIEEFVPAGEPCPKIFRLLDAVIDLFDSVSLAQPLLRYFELWMLKLSGFFPDLGRCSACHRQIDLASNTWISRDGSAYCVQCRAAGSQAVSEPVKRLVFEIQRNHPREFVHLPADADSLRFLGLLNRQLIRHHLERELKAYSYSK